MDDEKNIEELASDFEKKIKRANFPHMETSDLLDLMDYYTRLGMDFEADLCRYIAERNDPHNPEVILTKAHTYADEGDWRASARLRAHSGLTGYDETLFSIEHTLRLGTVARALQEVIASLPKFHDIVDYDFIFDAATLFRDYGYADSSLRLLDLIPPTYTDWVQVQDMRVECHALMGRYVKAKEILNSLLDLSPFSCNLWVRMATCCYRDGTYDEALEACEYALAIKSDDDDALRLRNLVRAHKADTEAEAEILAYAYEQQDWQICLDIADRCYERASYADAIPPYCFAGLFCPRGQRDRERIVARLALCHFHCGNSADAMPHLLALCAYGGQYWDTYHEAAQILFEKGLQKTALEVIDIALRNHELHTARYGQLAALLAHYECYEDARNQWNEIISNLSTIPQSYKKYVLSAIEHLK